MKIMKRMKYNRIDFHVFLKTLRALHELHGEIIFIDGYGTQIFTDKNRCWVSCNGFQGYPFPLFFRIISIYCNT